MNNSNIQLDEAVPLDIGEKADNTPMLRSREAELSRLIDAMERLIGSEYWKIVEGMHLIPEANKLARRLRTEKTQLKSTDCKGGWNRRTSQSSPTRPKSTGQNSRT